MSPSIEEAREEAAAREQELRDEQTLLSFCLTEDEYREVLDGHEPPQVCRRRDRYYRARQ